MVIGFNDGEWATSVADVRSSEGQSGPLLTSWYTTLSSATQYIL